jgi:hypothetical protein
MRLFGQSKTSAQGYPETLESAVAMASLFRSFAPVGELV